MMRFRWLPARQEGASARLHYDVLGRTGPRLGWDQRRWVAYLISAEAHLREGEVTQALVLHGEGLWHRPLD